MAGKLTRRDFLREASSAGAVLPLLAQADNLSAPAAAADGGKNFRGIFAILSSPFTLNDQLDEEDLEREVDFCVRAGAHGVVWPQLASEFYVLSENEQRRGAETIIKAAQGKIAVMIGTQAPSKEIAVQFARHAQEKGADAVIALPPYLGPVTLEAAAEYYRAIAKAIRLPVFIQNSGGQWGPTLPISLVTQLAKENPQLAYVKDEIPPITHRLGEYKSSGIMKAIFSGNAGRFMLNELARGSSGTMPSCEFVDIHVQIYNLAKNGRMPEARDLFQKLLPMTNLKDAYSSSFAKAILVRRGVLKTVKRRGVADTRPLDAVDEEETDAWWQRLVPFFKV